MTGAISISRNRYLPGYNQPFYLNGTPLDPPVPTSPLNREHFDEYRPATTYVKPDSSGWRTPTRFWHYGSHSTPAPGGAFAMEVVNNPYAYTLHGDGAGWNNSVYGLQSLPDYLEDRAVTKALLGLKDEKINLSQNFGERQQLIDLTIDAANKCVGLISDFLKKKRALSRGKLMSLTLKDLKKLPKGRNTKGLINDFLAVQYGVRPLMQDVHGAADALNKRERDGNSYRATVHGRVGENFDTSWWKSSDYSGLFGYRCQVTESHRVHVRLDYALDNPLLASLSQLGITNPADLAWELLPFSFVVDWFLPVGNYLNAFDAALGWTFVGGSLSCISRNTVRSNIPTWEDPSNHFPFKLLVDYSPYQESNYHFERYVYASSPLPRVPRFKNPFSGQHVANAIALIFAGVRY